jgi:hypothetical protein
MAFTEAQLDAQIDPGLTTKVANITAFIPGAVNTSIFIVGVTAPYAGKCRWTDVPNTDTAAQAWAAIQANLN